MGAIWHLGARRGNRATLLSGTCLIQVVLSCRSMVRAIEGMVKEKDAIFVTLIATVVIFQLIALCCCFIMMYDNAAYASSAILAVGTYYWYTYCLRIYNRFRIHQVQFAWKEVEEGPRSSPPRTRHGGTTASIVNPSVDSVFSILHSVFCYVATPRLIFFH